MKKYIIEYSPPTDLSKGIREFLDGQRMSYIKSLIAYDNLGDSDNLDFTKLINPRVIKSTDPDWKIDETDTISLGALNEIFGLPRAIVFEAEDDESALLIYEVS